jgi:DNA-binding helix-hairpin-helix protein with protein kinase domain
MKLVDDQGRPIQLASDCKSGGEGRVHAVIGSPDVVAKIYHSGSVGAVPEKLRLLIAAKSDALLEVAAWPTCTLHEKKAKRPVVGFLMPKISGFEEIHKLYGPEDRLRIFPDADWRALTLTAVNLAAAFHVVHERGFLVADVNENNTLVAADGSIRFIDCDSFQVRTVDGRVFRCGVGRPEFTPPELQPPIRVSDVDRVANHDCFGLAVMIFQLLFMGRHPYSGDIRQSQFV